MGRSYRVLLDTNMILTPFEMNIDITSELHRVLPGKIELITLSPVVEELKKKKRGVGIKLIKSLNLKVIPAIGNADEAIFGYAIKNPGVVVATNDDALKRKLREKGVPVVIVRGKQKLELEGYVGW